MAKQATDAQQKKYNLLVGFTCLHYSVSEAIGTLRVEILKKATGDDLKIGVRTRNGTAIAGSDFEMVDQEVEFGESDMVKEVPIKIINDDAYEENEDFFVEIYDP